MSVWYVCLHVVLLYVKATECGGKVDVMLLSTLFTEAISHLISVSLVSQIALEILGLQAGYLYV